MSQCRLAILFSNYLYSAFLLTIKIPLYHVFYHLKNLLHMIFRLTIKFSLFRAFYFFSIILYKVFHLAIYKLLNYVYRFKKNLLRI
mmetsp:Transcript_12141/g.1832  ORF Transcript_12141/g.1832 Transcript_12141/m.1832 type:complete len:86 (-) Transcript_12141:328-585(-)